MLPTRSSMKASLDVIFLRVSASDVSDSSRAHTAPIASYRSSSSSSSSSLPCDAAEGELDMGGSLSGPSSFFSSLILMAWGSMSSSRPLWRSCLAFRSDAQSGPARLDRSDFEMSDLMHSCSTFTIFGPRAWTGHRYIAMVWAYSLCFSDAINLGRACRKLSLERTMATWAMAGECVPIPCATRATRSSSIESTFSLGSEAQHPSLKAARHPLLTMASTRVGNVFTWLSSSHSRLNSSTIFSLQPFF
mmetsp:Transcript_43833/g.129772  ORF Transcript_43833/g.129772 Transcript_43833/m.129772 type:complete len:247 (+) Transcript_43833:542-1282(+)